jgi:hypothetical protein
MDTNTAHGVTRRSLLLGAGALAGAAAVTQSASPAFAAAPSVALRPQALSSAMSGLTYIAIDAQQMWPSKAADRVYQDITGSQGLPNDRIWAGLPLPVGSVVRQISVGYQGQPIVEISRRAINQPNPALQPEQVFQLSAPASPGGPFSSTLNLTTPVTIEANYSYTLSFFLTAGVSVFGASIGYLPPIQGFIPFTGTSPRVLDTRNPGPLTGKLQPNEERVIDLALAGARSAVINLTVTNTVNGGFLSVFAANTTFPGNSSINWSNTGENIANSVITGVDQSGRIKIRGGDNPTDVIIDRVGFLL